MADFTSTQTGNFSAAATWGGGGAPSADGDTFTIANGHTVTIDTGVTNPTNGFGDSLVQNGGILQSQAGQSVTLRMDGLLTVQDGGTLHLRAGTTFEVTGVSSENHGVQVNGSAALILEGSNGTTCTTLSSTAGDGSTSLSFTSVTGFSVGDWFAVFDNTTDDSSTDQYAPRERYSDEGFWVHDISGTTVYFRRFVSPQDVSITIQESSTVAIVSNSKRLRNGDKVIFGTGANRNILTVSSIDYSSDKVTFTSAMTGTVEGETVYLTGTEKPHSTGDKVRKVATVTTASATINSTQITVSNAADFSIGDDIWIERRSEADGTTDHRGDWNAGTNFKELKHTITNISSNTITVSTAIGYTVVEGALVTRMTRDLIFKATTPDTDHAHLYAVYNSTWGNGKLVMKDVYFKDWGNDSSGTVQGVVLRGYRTTDNLSVTLTETVPSYSRASWIEGIVVHAYPDSTHQRDWGPLWLYDIRGATAKCCMTMYGDDGVGVYYENGCTVFNTISTGGDSFGFRVEGHVESNEVAYIYSSRNIYGCRIYSPYDIGGGCHDFIVDACRYGLSVRDAGGGLVLRNSQITGVERGLYMDFAKGSSGIGLNKVTVKSLSGILNVDAGTGTRQEASAWAGHMEYSPPGAMLSSVEHNWELDQIRVYGYHIEAYYDQTEGAWRIFRRDNSSGDASFGEQFYLPQGVSAKIQASVKLAPSFSGTYPKLYAYGINNVRLNGGYGASYSAGSFFSGYRQESAYTAAAASDYETVEITVPAQTYNTYIGAAVVSDSSNATEGYWVKNFRILLDTPYQNPAFNIMTLGRTPAKGGIVTEVGTSFDTKTRLGGRLS